MQGLIMKEQYPEGLLCLVADELDNFAALNVATALSELGKMCRDRSFPHNIAADYGFRGLMLRARDMCDGGDIDVRAVVGISHAVVGRCRILTVSKPELKARLLSALETKNVMNRAFKL